MIDSIFIQYLRERKGATVLTDAVGFVAYKIGGTECFIVDMCVHQKQRTAGEGRRLIDQLGKIARDAGCKEITANVHLADPGSNKTLIAALMVGFQVVRAGNDILLISKSLED